MSGIFENIILLNSCADVSVLFDLYSPTYIEYQKRIYHYLGKPSLYFRK